MQTSAVCAIPAEGPLSGFPHCLQRAGAVGRRRWGIHVRRTKGLLDFLSTEIAQFAGVQPHHLLICDALGLDSSWYTVPSVQKNGRDFQTP